MRLAKQLSRQFQGTTTQTDRYGNFTPAFSVDEEDDGTRILLTVKGEEFPLHNRFGQVAKSLLAARLFRTLGLAEIQLRWALDLVQHAV